MLKGRLIHPELLRALGAAGHGAKVLLADGNYPVSTKAPASAVRVYLNLTPGVLSVTVVLGVLADAIPIEAAEVMVPADGPEPPVFDEFRRLLDIGLSPLRREEFYDAACSPDVAVVVATGESRIYANLLLTIGIVV